MVVERRGRPKNPPKAKQMLKEVIPIDDIFDEGEKKIYEALVDIYLNDFDKEDLTSSDMDDVMSLAMNRVLEIRLLKSSKGEAEKHLDISLAIEKLRKQNDKIKDNLSSRRKDRINPNEYKGFSIVDLAVAFEQSKKNDLLKRHAQNKEEEDEKLVNYREYTGNKYDADVQLTGEKEDLF